MPARQHAEDPVEHPGDAMLSTQDEQDMVTALAARALEELAPEELVILDSTARAYFEDPDRALRADRREASVGFGLDLALLTPVLLAVAQASLGAIVAVVGQTVRQETGPVVRRWYRRLVRLPPAAADGSATPGALDAQPGLSRDQVRQVHAAALERGLDLGLPPERARLLADAVVGGLLADG